MTVARLLLISETAPEDAAAAVRAAAAAADGPPALAAQLPLQQSGASGAALRASGEAAQTLHLPVLPARVQQELQPADPRADAHRREAVPVRRLWQGLPQARPPARPQVSSGEMDAGKTANSWKSWKRRHKCWAAGVKNVEKLRC